MAGGRTFGHRLERGRESSQPLLALTANKCFDIYCPRSQPQFTFAVPLSRPLSLPPSLSRPSLTPPLKWPKCATSNVIVVLVLAMHLKRQKEMGEVG